ncbi:MAG: leucine-rich repeat domain-containing protein [Bacillota bacterium]|nr:leucine-rich repeat domain-containing protein [Bacillota bacterium]
MKRNLIICIILFTIIVPFMFGCSNNPLINSTDNAANASAFEYKTFSNHVEITDVKNHNDVLTIPSEYNGKPVTRIAPGAFYNDANLKKITFPDSIIGIYNDAFLSCKNLTEIDFGNGLQTVGDFAFADCNSLSSIYIPKSVVSIGSNALLGTKKLTKIEVAADNPKFTVMDGILYSKDRTQIVRCPVNKSVDNYKIPSTVKDIGDCSFSYNLSIKTINIPENVTRIGDNAFESDTNLNNISFPNKLSYIGDNALHHTAWIDRQNEEFVTINKNFLIAWKGTGDTFDIPQGITHVSWCHDSNILIRTTNVPKSVCDLSQKTISSASIINVDSENKTYLMIDNTLYNHDKTRLIYAFFTETDYTVPNNVIEICAFKVIPMRSIVIPDSVKKIPPYLFSNAKYTNTKFSIYCHAGSYAEKYAKEYGFSYVLQ